MNYDITWCNFHEDCKHGKECDRALTKQVIYRMKKLGIDKHISHFSDKPECHEESDNAKRRR